MRIRTALGVATTTLCLLVAPGAAQESADTVVYPLPGLSVTALRLPVPRAAVPLNVTVVDGETLRARGIRSLAEALDEWAGITVVETGSFGGTTSIFVRGGESDYVRVLIDGVPVNAPGGGLNIAHLTAANIDRIEVVRGPSSVLYGSDAVAAVIEIHTREGAGAPKLDARARGGSHGTVDLAVAVFGGGDRLSYSASLSNFDTDGVLDFNNQYRNTEASARLALQPDELTSIALSLRYSDHDFHFPTNGAGALVDRNQFTAGDRTVASLDASRRFGPVEAEITLGAHRSDEGIRDAFDDAEDAESLRTDDEARRLLADARAHVRLEETAVLTIGGLVEDESLETALASESSFGPFESAAANDRSTRALYGQVLLTPRTDVSLTGGVRYEDNEIFGSHTTWRLGASFAPAAALRVRASAGTGFKEPTFFENFAEGFALGNPDLVPEESRSWEVGLDAATRDGAATLSATFFDQRFDELIDFTFAPPVDGDPNFFNIARADARGMEISGEAALGGGIGIAADYTWLDTEVRDPGFDVTADATFAPGQRLLRRPRHSWSSRVTWRSQAVGVLAAEGRYVGAREDQDFSSFPAVRVESDAFFLLDVSAEVPLLRSDRGRRLAAVVRIENLLDESYEDPTGFQARGFTVLAGLRAGLGR
ncbi:MAG: TonB-dependent receptor [Gemmatimonadota bacterium]